MSGNPDEYACNPLISRMKSIRVYNDLDNMPGQSVDDCFRIYNSWRAIEDPAYSIDNSRVRGFTEPARVKSYFAKLQDENPTQYQGNNPQYGSKRCDEENGIRDFFIKEGLANYVDGHFICGFKFKDMIDVGVVSGTSRQVFICEPHTSSTFWIWGGYTDIIDNTKLNDTNVSENIWRCCHPGENPTFDAIVNCGNWSTTGKECTAATERCRTHFSTYCMNPDHPGRLDTTPCKYYAYVDAVGDVLDGDFEDIGTIEGGVIESGGGGVIGEVAVDGSDGDDGVNWVVISAIAGGVLLYVLLFVIGLLYTRRKPTPLVAA